MTITRKKTDLIKGLNSEQVTAVTFKEGPLLIVAGAGTGKTTVITRRVAWLIHNGLAKPDEILALTFTDKASAEMEERIDLLLPMGYVNVNVATFHAFCESVLKDYALEIGLPNDFKLLTQTEQWLLVRQNLDRFNLDYYRPLGNPTRFIHALIQHFSRCKDEEVYPEDYLKLAETKRLSTGASEYIKKSKTKIYKSKIRVEKSVEVGIATDVIALQNEEGEASRLEEVASAYHVYQQLLLERGVFDFGDLINYTLKLFRQRPKILAKLQEKYKYILVDEFQDTNYAQYQLVRLLGEPKHNVTVVGDDDQSIYKFRGASISNILEFKHDYPKAEEVFLNINYRSFQKILDVSYNFIQQNNPDRLEVKLAGRGKLSKKLQAHRSGPAVFECIPFRTGQDEAHGVLAKILELRNNNQARWADFAILVRANASAQAFVQAFRQNGVPFDYVANKGLYTEPIILDLTSYLKLLNNYHESEAVYRILTAVLFIPHDDAVKLAHFAYRKTISLYESIHQAYTIGLTADGLKIVQNFLALLAQHTALAHHKGIGELVIKVIEDLGLGKRAAKDETGREAQYLAAFYSRVQSFEADNSDHQLNNFLKYYNLELEAGDEGQLPVNYDDGPDTVKIITVHSAKGLEWRYVFLVQLIDRRFPSVERHEPIELPKELVKEILPEGDAHLQEERRLFYVGLTRARDGVFLTYAQEYSGKSTRKPSRFLHELGLVKEKEIELPTGQVLFPKAVTNTPPAVRLPVPETFSFTSVSCFKKCPLEFKYRYVLKLPTPGAAALSYGSSMHKTFEKFLRIWQAGLSKTQPDLFGVSRSVQLPSFEQLKILFDESWIDDWYLTKVQKNDYRTKRAPKQLKNFYDEFLAHPPKPKYLEKLFKIGMGRYAFSGKIDRVDEGLDGVAIVDYKTGGEPAAGLVKVDKDQLIIYQIAAEELLREKVVKAQYWYLESNKFSNPFVATPEQITKFKQEYTALIEEIVNTIKTNNFVEADEAVSHECMYKLLV